MGRPIEMTAWGCSGCSTTWLTQWCAGQTQALWITSRGAGSPRTACASAREPDAESEREPEPADSPPTILGSVIGYRAWRLLDWQLKGTYADRVWEPGVTKATCDSGVGRYWDSKHAAPGIACDCGLTALARFSEDHPYWPDGVVRGAIEAWSDETDADIDAVGPGLVLDGLSFRAQYAKVVLLAVDDDWPAAKRAAVRALAAEHGADVCERDRLEDAAKEHGQLVPDELLEWAADEPPLSWVPPWRHWAVVTTGNTAGP